MSAGYPLDRIGLLAKRLGVSFAEAARLAGRKGARRRRERARSARPEPEAARPAKKYWWQEAEL